MKKGELLLLHHGRTTILQGPFRLTWAEVPPRLEPFSRQARRIQRVTSSIHTRKREFSGCVRPPRVVDPRGMLGRGARL